MGKIIKKSGVSFVYDGACPMCENAAHALRIKKNYGDIHLINARDATDDPLMVEILRRGYDLDEGMVIYAEETFYHGKDALRFMAKSGDVKNIFTAMCKGLFWSDTIASLTYPWMRATRNWLLKRRKVEKINTVK